MRPNQPSLLSPDPHRLMESLVGAWSMSRTILPPDAAGPPIGTARGRATFTWDPVAGDDLDYREEGEMVLTGAAPVAFSRRYRYTVEAGALAIRFADGDDTGRLFVALTFGEDVGGAVSAEASHHCAPDRYEMAMTVLPGIVSTAVAVTGPRKAHRIETVLTRAA